MSSTEYDVQKIHSFILGSQQDCKLQTDILRRQLQQTVGSLRVLWLHVSSHLMNVNPIFILFVLHIVAEYSGVKFNL